MVLTFVFMLLAQPSDPADPATKPAPQRAAPPAVAKPTGLRVAVLPTSSATLASDEAALLTQLLAIRVERDGFDVVDASDCADAGCLASIAAQMNVDAVLLAEHGKLGEADVLTLLLFDASAGRVYRDAASSSERGALAEATAPLVAGMLARVVSALPPARQPAIRMKLAQGSIDIEQDASGWWFVDGTGRAVSENEFVRRYRFETQRRRLDFAEIDREPDFGAWAITIGGVATGITAVGLTLYFTTTPDGQAIANASDDAWVIIPALGMSVALGLSIYGLVELSESRLDDGSELDHVLDIDTARAASAEHNDALLQRLAREQP